LIDLIRKCYDLVGHGRRLKWAALIGLALVVTVVEALGAGLIFVLLALITDPHAPIRLPLVGDISRYLPGRPDEGLLLVVAAAIAGFVVVRSALKFGQAYVQQRVAQRAGAQLATRLLRGYLMMPYAFHLQRNSAELIRNALQSVQTVIMHAIVPLVRLIAEVLVIVGLITVLVSVSPLATGLVAAVLGPLMLVACAVAPRLSPRTPAPAV
jgi:ATP-binding cassette, subfamily B, bacterial PglK